MKLILRPILFSFTRYKVPYNINKQQHQSYLKKVQRAQSQLSSVQKPQLIPRRKRRLFDREKIDRNIQGYGAWRVYDPQQQIHKVYQSSMTVDLKIKLPPKWLIHAFGMGCLPQNNLRSSHREYHFEDNRFNKFLLYQYRNTTHYKQNIEGYDYQHQQHLHPRLRIIKRLTPQEFWKSQELFQFRLNSTVYAEKFKFQQWILKEIQRKKTEKSYDQFIDQKYGKVITFNKKQQASLFQPNKPMVTTVAPQHFNPPKKGKEPQPPKVKLGRKMDEKYRVKEKQSNIPEETKQEKKESVAKGK